jgi:general secretion pathway protein D
LASLLTGTAFGIFGPEIPEAQSLIGLSVPSFGVALNAAASSSDVDILSTPHLMAMDNVQAEITVGENIPLQTSGLGASGGLSSLAGLSGLAGSQGASSGAAGLAGLAGLAGGLGGSLPRQDVGTTLRILPHINDSGQIRMEIEQEISSEGARDGPNGAVSINRRTAKTQVVVRDQETIVIGGQVRESLRTTERRVPILGDIPLIGALFRQTQTDTVRSNLLLFLTPYVIRDHSDLRRIFERKMQERQEFLDRHFVFGEHDYSPHVDYTRTRGLVMEIIQELGEIEEERALIEAAAAEPPPDHVPRPPVDAEPLIGEGDEVIVPDGEDGPSAAETAPAPSADATEGTAPAAPVVAAGSDQSPTDTEPPQEG